MNIYVGNLSFDASDDALRELFSSHGEVVSAKIVMDRDSGRSKGFGFVEMAVEGDGEKAISALDGQEWLGRPLRVNKSIPKTGGSTGFGGGGGRPNNNRRPGGGGGGFNRR